MGFLTSQQLKKYYDYFQNSEITFTKEVIQAMNFNTQQVSIRCIGSEDGRWPCVIHSSSMMNAKVIIQQHCTLYEKISEGMTAVSLWFSFFQANGKNNLSFYVSGKVANYTPYTVSPDLVLLDIEYTQRAPDDLIEKLGLLIDAKTNTAKRAEERIELSAEVMRKLSLSKKETIIHIENIPRRCILRDISFSGAKFIMTGIAPFLLNKDCTLKIAFEEPDTVIELRGKIIRTELVEKRKDLIATAMAYNMSSVPLSYKIRLTQYFNQQRKIHPGADA